MIRQWPMALVLLAVAALGLMGFLLLSPATSPVAGQEEEVIPGCPDDLTEGVRCVYRHEWPPFTIVYEWDVGASISVPGAEFVIDETHLLEWRGLDDWHMTVIDAQRYDFGLRVHDTTGSWDRLSGRTNTEYDSATGDTHTIELQEGEFLVLPFGLHPNFLSGHDLATRTDGELVQTIADVCTGDECHEVLSGTAGTSAPQGAVGRRFSDPDLRGYVFTDDAWRLPLVGPNFRVLELQIHPTEPDEDACQTNMRAILASDFLARQEWTDNCMSRNRIGANAHFYTFTLDEGQDVTIRAGSPADDVYMYLMSGAAMDGTVLAENDNATDGGAGGSSDAPAQSVIKRTLDAGTYTVEVTTSALAHSEGSFGIRVDVPPEPPTIAMIPTPTPTLDYASASPNSDAHGLTATATVTINVTDVPE